MIRYVHTVVLQPCHIALSGCGPSLSALQHFLSAFLRCCKLISRRFAPHIKQIVEFSSELNSGSTLLKA